ncbi:MAG TPA: DUF3263 domain-containing protein [Acidimicrobiia bacterium]|nr:DUF3263 domain-containing protein [Acidimicrobiia bacterium]
MGLSPRDRDILDFERSWWTQPGSKQRAIREMLGMSGTHYYRRLSELLDEPDALKHDPLTVKRARRLREQRRRVRIEGRRAK